jgi:hypothetical protein
MERSARSHVVALAELYQEKTGRMLSLNDASLQLGGVIAKSRITPEHEAVEKDTPRCHGSHRIGVDIDINRVDMGGKNMAVETIEVLDKETTLLEFMDDEVEQRRGSLHHSYNRSGELTSIHWRLP